MLRCGALPLKEAGKELSCAVSPGTHRFYLAVRGGVRTLRR